ncbi:MAG: hypothetical protein WCK02_11470 [Bacteroidota bacterium]
MKNIFKNIAIIFILVLSIFQTQAQSPKTIGTGTTDSRFQPIGAYYGYNRSACIYTAAQIGATNITITHIGWQVASTGSASIPIKIYIKTTTATQPAADTWANYISGLTPVYNASYTFSATGYVSFDITDFSYTGNNLLILVETNYTGSGAGVGGYPYFETTSSSTGWRTWFADSSPPTTTGSISASEGYLPNIKITYTTPVTSTSWTGAVSTNWTTAGNWSDGVPTSTISAVIADVTNDPIIGATTIAECNNLTINSGAILTIGNIDASGGTFSINGNLTNNGNIYHTSDLNTNLKGVNKTLGGSGNFAYNNEFVSFSLSAGASYTLANDITLINQIRLNTGSTFNLSSYTISIYTFSFDDGTFNCNTGTIEIGNTISYTAGTFNCNTGTVYFNSGDTKWTNFGYSAVSQTINSFTYYNLNVRSNNGCIATLGSGTTISIGNNFALTNPGTAGGVATTNNDISIAAAFNLGTTGNGLTLNITTSGRIYRTTSGTGFTMGNISDHNINITYAHATNYAIGNYTDALTFYGTATYNSSGDQKIQGSSYSNLTLAGAGIKTLTASTSISGNLTHNAGTLAVSTYTLTITGISDINSTSTISTGTIDANGSFDATGGTIDFTDNGFLKLGGSTITGLGTLDELIGTVSYDRAGAQNVISDNYYNLTIDGSGIKTALNNNNIAGELSLDAGTYALNSTTTTVTGLSDINGTLTISTGVFDANGNFDATGGTIDFTDAGFLNLGGTTITSLGTLDNTAGTVAYDRTGDQTVLLDNYFNIKIDGIGTKTQAGAIDIDGSLSLSAGTLAVSASNYGISLAGDLINSGGSFSYGTGTVTLDGASTQRINVTTEGGTTPRDADFSFYNVIIDSSNARFYYNQTNDRKITVNDLQINNSKSIAIISL